MLYKKNHKLQFFFTLELSYIHFFTTLNCKRNCTTAQTTDAFYVFIIYTSAFPCFVISRAQHIYKLGVDGHNLTSILLNGVKRSAIKFCHSTGGFIYPPYAWGSHVYKLNQRQKLHAKWWNPIPFFVHPKTKALLSLRVFKWPMTAWGQLPFLRFV
jgi:hypothetical protein